MDSSNFKFMAEPDITNDNLDLPITYKKAFQFNTYVFIDNGLLFRVE